MFISPGLLPVGVTAGVQQAIKESEKSKSVGGSNGSSGGSASSKSTSSSQSSGYYDESGTVYPSDFVGPIPSGARREQESTSSSQSSGSSDRWESGTSKKITEDQLIPAIVQIYDVVPQDNENNLLVYKKGEAPDQSNVLTYNDSADIMPKVSTIANTPPDELNISSSTWRNIQQAGGGQDFSQVEQNILANQDRTGMTATADELPWTMEGAREDLSLGGTYEPTFDEIQEQANRELSKISSRGGSTAEEMSLSKKHYVGDDEEGNPVYVPENPYSVKFDWNVNDPDYSTIRNDIVENRSGAKDYLTDMRSQKTQLNTTLNNLERNLQNVRQAENDTTWTYNFNESKLQQNNPDLHRWIKTNVGFKDQYTRSEAEKLTEHFIDINETSLSTAEQNIKSLNQYLEESDDTLFTLNKHEELNYEVDQTDEGIKFSLPKASTVHSDLYGDQEGLALTASAFIESPLAIKTVGSAIWQGVTGDDKVGETRREELSQFSLGLLEAKQEGAGAYVATVGTSPAMVQGVYLPIATMGAGYAMTGLSTGASGLGTAGGSTLAKIGSTTGGKILNVGAKGAMVGVGAYGVYKTGEGLYETYEKKPEALPGQIAETAFTFGMAYGGYKTGQNLYHSRHPINIPQKDITGEINFEKEPLTSQIQGVKRYRLFTKPNQYIDIGGKKIQVDMVGIGEKGQSGVTLTEGQGTLRWTNQSWLKSKIGIGSEESWLRSFKTSGSGIKIGDQGEIAISKIVGSSQLLAGEKGGYGYGQIGYEPYGYGGQAYSKKLGTMQPPEGSVFLKGSLPEEYAYLTSGKYSGNFMKGDVATHGTVIDWTNLGKAGGSGSSYSSGGVSLKIGGGGSGMQGLLGSGAKTAGAQAYGLSQIGSTPALTGYNASIAGLLPASTGTGQSTTQETETKTYQAQQTTVDLDTDVNVYNSGSGRQITIGRTENKQDQETKTDTEQVIDTDNTFFQKSNLITTQQNEQRTQEDTTQETVVLTSDIQQNMDETVNKNFLQQVNIQETGNKNILDPKIDIVPVTRTDIGVNQDNFMGTDLLQTQPSMLKQNQEQEMRQLQKQKLVQKQDLDLVQETITPLPSITPSPIPPPPPFPFNFGDPKSFVKRKKKTKRKTKPKIMQKEKGDKGLLSDLLSVTRSQARYGTATHPSLTKKTWKEGEKTLYSRVPTKELKKKKRRKKPKLLGRNKDVLI